MFIRDNVIDCKKNVSREKKYWYLRFAQTLPFTISV